MFRREEIEEDRTVDRLLRAQAAKSAGNRPAGRRPVATGCSGFDPDLANAYVERALAISEVQGYEEHLSQCSACRTTVARLALADNRTIYGPPMASAVDRSSGRAGFAAMLTSLLFRPQWAAAMVAVLILLISIPVFLTRSRSSAGKVALDRPPSSSETAGKNRQSSERVAEPQSAANPAAGVVAELQTGSANGSPNKAGEESDGSAAKDAESKKAVAGYLDAPAAVPPTLAAEARNDMTPPASQPAAGPPRSEAAGNSPGAAGSVAKEKTEQQQSGAREARDRSSQAQTSDESRRSQAPAQTKPQSQQIDSAEAMQVPQDQSSQQESGQAVVLKKGVPGGDVKQLNDKVATVKPQDSVAPQAKSTDDGAADTRRVIARAHSDAAKPEARSVGGEALVGRQGSSRKNDRSRIEKKIEGKKFRLVDGVWTDRQYNPYKEMPSVTVLRGSDVFNSLIGKEPELKLYFAGFGQQDRVIVIYKKVAYRLVPQPASK